jgi:radical SAM protein with 4Fe4S-binding SPASM domain
MRFLHLAFAVIRSNFSALARPYRIDLSLTDRCNLRCASCGIWKTTDHDSELSLDELTRIFRAMPFCSWLNLTGGEIFMRNDIGAILDAAALALPHLYFLNFTTNGSMPSRTADIVASFVKKHPAVRLVISVSIDGPKTVHDRLRGVTGAWDNAVSTYRLLRQITHRNLSVYCGMTLQKDNAGAYLETVKALADVLPAFSERDLHVNFAQTSSHYYRNDKADVFFVPDTAYIQALLAARKLRLWQPFDLVEKIYLRLFDDFAKAHRCPLPCKAADASCFIDAHGLVYPCVSDPRTVGDLRTNDYAIMPIWNSTLRRDIRKEIACGRCPHCWTPCEAYHTIGGSIAKAARYLC